MHEEASVAMAHGYAKIEGKPMACMMHTTVGLQHASMAIYNAYADRVPDLHDDGRVDRRGTPRQSAVDWTARRHRRPGDGARLHQVGRHAGLAAALRRIRRAGVEVRDDPAVRADAAGRRHAACRRTRFPAGKTARRRSRSCRASRRPQARKARCSEVARLLVNAEHPRDLRRPRRRARPRVSSCSSSWPKPCRRRSATAAIA